MEDPDLEGEIQECSPSKGDNTKLRWILNMGLGLGKKVVITGIAISSAPLVLPPLAVISALGLAFSVPFGLVFASYACTDKLMSKLRPTPTSPLMWEYYEDEDDEEEEDFGGEVVMEDEEDEQMEETMQGAEMRIKLHENDVYRQKDEVVSNLKEEEMPSLDEHGEEAGYEEDVGECLEGEDDNLEGMEVREDGGRQKLVREGSEDEEPPLAEMSQVVILVRVNEENNGISREVEELHLVAREVKGDTRNEEKVSAKEEEMVRGSTGWLEKIRNEENIGTAAKNDSRGIKEVDVGDDDKNVRTREPIEEPFGDRSVELEKLIGEVKRTGAEGREVTISEEKEKHFHEKDVKSDKFIGKMKGTNGEKREETVSEENRMLETRNEENSVPYKVQQVEEAEGTILENRNVTVTDKGTRRNLDRIGEKQKAALEKKVVMQGRAKDDTILYIHDDISLEEEENVIQSNADAREIADESGFDLLDDKKAASDQNSCTALESLEANDNAKDSTAERNGDFLERPVSVRVRESNYTEIASETNIEVPSNEVFFHEKKIWEKIDAMRSILGYKATPQLTCMGELKALYIFTGVELPMSFKDHHSDLVEVNDKLQFLMSIVGVK